MTTRDFPPIFCAPPGDDTPDAGFSLTWDMRDQWAVHLIVGAQVTHPPLSSHPQAGRLFVMTGWEDRSVLTPRGWDDPTIFAHDGEVRPEEWPGHHQRIAAVIVRTVPMLAGFMLDGMPMVSGYTGLQRATAANYFRRWWRIHRDYLLATGYPDDMERWDELDGIVKTL